MTLAWTKRQDPAQGAEGAHNDTAHHLAHDARNWLTVLQVYCDLLCTAGGRSNARQRMQWMGELSKAVQRGQGLVNSLADIVLVSSSPARTLPVPAARASATLDLAEALRRRLPVLRQLAGGATSVELEFPPEPVLIALGEAEFERVLLNLARNAFEAMPEGGRLKISLSRAKRPRRNGNARVRTGRGRRSSMEKPPIAVLHISDTGDGIEPELLPHIFESGVTSKSSGRATDPERGFGLAIVRELVLAAGGRIRVRSRMGHGTCFTLELPRAGASEPSSTRRAGEWASVTEMPRAAANSFKTQDFGPNGKGTRVPC